MDVAGSRLAAHHFRDPAVALAEMRRVTRRGGAICVVDLVAPDDERLAAVNHRIEVLHDPTHERSYSSTWWRGTFDRAGLALLAAESTHAERPNGLPLDRWCAIAESSVDTQHGITELLDSMSATDRDALGWSRRDGTYACSVRTVLLCGAHRD